MPRVSVFAGALHKSVLLRNRLTRQCKPHVCRLAFEFVEAEDSPSSSSAFFMTVRMALPASMCAKLCRAGHIQGGWAMDAIAEIALVSLGIVPADFQPPLCGYRE